MTPPLVALVPLALQQPTPSSMSGGAATGGPGWLVAVNLVIWTGLFLFLLRLERRLGDGRSKERER